MFDSFTEPFNHH